jgi:hypothetical protein
LVIRHDRHDRIKVPRNGALTHIKENKSGVHAAIGGGVVSSAIRPLRPPQHQGCNPCLRHPSDAAVPVGGLLLGANIGADNFEEADPVLGVTWLPLREDAGHGRDLAL